ncbi:MAG TPA: CBS domain-containing protein [Xanthobacteraceae bacterium]|nr:CBS domain-containing protein [Xanthobacteraceae bacterium]
MKAADVMTRNVVSVAVDAPLIEAMRLMLKHSISGLPVLDRDGKLVGVITESDLLRLDGGAALSPRPHWIELLMKPERLPRDYATYHGRKVGEAMTADPVTIGEDDSLDGALRLMEIHHIKRLLVVRGGDLVGVISRGDLLRALSRAVREAGELAQRSERSWQRAARLESQLWMRGIKP